MGVGNNDCVLCLDWIELCYGIFCFAVDLEYDNYANVFVFFVKIKNFVIKTYIVHSLHELKTISPVSI